MRNKEFDIVRDLIAGRTPPAPETTHQGLTLAPASFREIDGKVLARQYVAHRKFLESTAQAGKSGTEEIITSGVRPHSLQGERRQNAVGQDAASGWFSGLWRFWRR
jgi:hypothetical protein